jgi:hypothetical protein
LLLLALSIAVATTAGGSAAFAGWFGLIAFDAADSAILSHGIVQTDI